MYIPNTYTNLSAFVSDYRIASYDKASQFLTALHPNFALPISNEFGKIRVNKLVRELNSTIELNNLRIMMLIPKKTLLDWARSK